MQITDVRYADTCQDSAAGARVVPSHGLRRGRNWGVDSSTACRSLADDGSTAGAGEASSQQSGNPANAAGNAAAKQYVQSSWAEMLLSMPLELAAASAKTNDHWLQKRKRKHWWKREQFPRVSLPLCGLNTCCCLQPNAGCCMCHAIEGNTYLEASYQGVTCLLQPCCRCRWTQ